MKKVLSLLLIVLCFIGCENIKNTPTNRVEEFFQKYQNMDTIVLKELEYVIQKDDTLNKKQKEKYQELLERQYQNLSYKITNEEIHDSIATVDVRIEVFDYKNTIEKAKDYYINHLEDFQKKREENVEEIDFEEAFIDYKLQEMKKTEEKIQYDMTFSLVKDEGMWNLEDLSEVDRQKIHGLF